MHLSEKIKKHVIGKRIVGISLNEFDRGDNSSTYDPSIHLEDGTEIRFIVIETIDGSDYGIDPIIVVKDSQHQRNL